MKVLVLGAGVVGITTAFELARDGHDVTVIDRCEGPGLETSFANGGQLSWDHGAPLAGPGVMQKAIKWLGKRDAPLLFRLRLDPAMWAWTLNFIANCAEPVYWHNAELILRLALFARERLHDILKTEAIAFDHRRGGILGLYQDARELDRDVDAIRSWRELGGSRTALDHKGCIELEPSLAYSTFSIAGGIHTPLDESGDCYAFTRHLAARAETLGVTFHWNTTVKGLKREGERITHALTDRGEEDADTFILALGSYSPQVMKGLDLKLPIYPAKGYSLTVPVLDDAMAPQLSITSNTHKLVFSRIGNSLRVAGMLELNGYDTELVEARARITLDSTMKLFPRACEPDHAKYWTGLRPLTPDSLPIVGHAKQPNLLLNTGHGMLGWTLAAGTARIVADLVRGHAPEVDISGLGWERFA
ncbi:MAG: D-amino acid dehydrogenase [Rhodospirillales bacterium]|nr:D-amino acid dehydrogenase [Rhodospirillales bacterium]